MSIFDPLMGAFDVLSSAYFTARKLLILNIPLIWGDFVGVEGVGLEYRQDPDGKIGDTGILVIYCRQYLGGLVSATTFLPAPLPNVEAQARVTGGMRPLARPAAAGVSVGTQCSTIFLAHTNGSLGAVVTSDNDPSTRFILSNNHVLSLNGMVLEQHNGNILQPAFVVDPHNSANNVIATVGPLPPFCQLTNGLNNGDFAIARVLNPGDVTPGLPVGMPVLSQSKPLNRSLAPGQTVFMFGNAGNRLRRGVVSGAVADFSLHYDSMNATFDFAAQLPIHQTDGLGAFSVPGDSGSLVVTENGIAAGIVFTSSGQDAMMSPLDAFFEDQSLSFVLPH